MEFLAVFPPLAAFLLAFLFGRQMGDKGAQFVTCAGIVIAAGASCYLFYDVILSGRMTGDPRTITLMSWISSGALTAEWALRVDQLSVVMMCVVNIVSACVHIYSIGYMSHDPARGRFMAYLSLFTFAMLMLVSADNLIQLFFGWEGVGLASYLLIGFWNHKDSANAAAIKAFVVNRVGDFGLALGVFAAFFVFGSVQFDVLFEQAADYADARIAFLGFDLHALTVICLLLFMGAMGKSAQLGLHTWLPDAMEGPTPVSALIHAATMVTAGVFMIARLSPVFEYAPLALAVVCVVGALTAFVAATIGLTQFDIKRVIAYSTMSQLGYMFFALGVSAYSAAIFHLVTHAFFKALLFLGAGSVIHALSDEQDMRKMGGLWSLIPVTYGLMWIGSLALAGIPFFAGYYSKDIILESAFADHSAIGLFAYWMGIAAAVMTAFYSGRLLFMTFHGKPRADAKVMRHVHESPRVMLWPLMILAIGAITSGAILYGGFVGSSEVSVKGHKAAQEVHKAAQEVHKDEHGAGDGAHGSAHSGGRGESVYINLWSRDYFWDESLFVLPANDTVKDAHHVPYWVKYLPAVMGALGLALAWLFYIRKTGLPAWCVQRLQPVHRLFFNKWFFDELYTLLIVRPAFRLGQLFWKGGDQGTIDRFGPDGISHAALRITAALRKGQTGYLFHYAFVMMVGVIALVSWVFYRISQGQG